MEFLLVILLFVGTYEIRLPNENCELRSEVVHLSGGNEIFYPGAVMLSRCIGLCNNKTKEIMRCSASETSELELEVFNSIKNENEILMITNHTECICDCVHTADVCYKTQKWNNETCHCMCDEKEKCNLGYQWNPQFCYCECDRICSRRMYLNESSCDCICEPKYFRRCNRKNLILDEFDCKCKKQTAESSFGNSKVNNQLSDLILPLFLLILIVIILIKVIRNCKI